MRSMLQLVGGVAVAGAVAAGSTAFTAGGVTAALSGTTSNAAGNAIVGGSTAVTIDGARLVGVKFTVSDATHPDRMDAVSISVDADASTNLSASSDVQVQVTGTGVGTATGTTWQSCTNAGAKQWDCTLLGYYTAVASMNVLVVPA